MNSNVQIDLIRRDQFKPIRAIRTIQKIRIESKKADVALVNGLFYEHYFANLFLRSKYIYKIVGDPVWEKYRNSGNRDISIEDFQKKKLSLKFRLLRLVLVNGLRAANKTVVPGFELKNVVEKWHIDLEVTQVNNGVPSELVRGVKETHDVVSVSRLVNWKNIDLLIKACSKAELSLLVIGEGPERDNLEKLVLQLNARVDFVGEKTPNEVRSFLHRAKVYALVSSYEGMAFSLLEAMMQQREIVVSRIPANTNLIENGYTGHVVPDWSIESIAACLVEARESVGTSCASNARELALNNYSINEINALYLGILNDVISQ
jgi:glycosyltransferase involved in cell wall biosynthesis